MHVTHVRFKNGKYVCGFVGRFRPREGYFLLEIASGKEAGSIKKYYFRNVKSMVTESERISILERSADDDELERARELGWNGK